ncbi:hypothetical protein RCG19_03410 [Neobacillus sp. OS1-2]|uniref:hypothetical protein n=1 Tax=Neobacillus sp. OS1-2 TaxID=3070680 RepID=UPI0027E1D185|nr:hypothetical protein [Neobacillus sp. OS1-2]WML40752.1 hypothetical protein RCG19_03410 [Neobacillus sp. OS1-2]
MNLTLLSVANEIEKAFKSLIKSGRPDITDDENNSLIESLYVDLFDNEYILRQVLDDNHTLLKGRRGTGKSTIFLRAEQEIQKNKAKFAIYINLQTCYEEVKSANSDEENLALTKYLTYKNFLTEILKSIQKRFSSKFSSDKEFEELFKAIEEGKYIDKDFQRSIDVTSTQSQENKSDIGGKLGLNNATLNVGLGSVDKNESTVSTKVTELRIFSIHEILKRIKEIANKRGISKIYLFLDDFSELNMDSQKVVIDSLIAPIISSYNETYKVKLAAYPSRIYTGNIDSTKLPSYALDFYDAYEQSSSTYGDVEGLAIDYISRTLAKRIEIYTKNQISLGEIFDLDRAPLEEYLKTLFYCSSSIPRSLGFILNYAYLSSINKGNQITIENINTASVKYFEENILADFINDVRFKQSFYDDKDLLDQIAQKNLMDKIVEKQFNVKRETIEQYQKGILKKQIFTETLEKNRKGPLFWMPTSHFFINKDTEKLLKTLELYFIVNKFNEGSSREPGKKISYYGLNYGLCLLKRIDYGRPAFRRTYDYWRQEEFNLNEYIPRVISNIEVIKCESCEKVYDETEYNIYVVHKKCFKCTHEDTVRVTNKFQTKFKKKIEEWHEKKLPDVHINVLRILYNNIDSEMTAYEIGTQIDRHHLSVTHAMRPLVNNKYVSYKERDKRYYKITDAAVTKFFSDTLDTIE